MGAFTFTPKSGKKYSVQVLNKQGIRKIFELPQVQESAYGIVAVSYTHLTLPTKLEV